ncbi:hypothetical protein Q0601_24485 [Paracoccus onubensis]|uniref:hypothetical protein n=1 Tax=Paracoccus onubensis TaxID=1675788 RepID=UPI002731AA73|nr:hypothetical protein [Paracoccus onubensis]MDP0930342.1 hypothetical protein [Paracoccus onubensis]
MNITEMKRHLSNHGLDIGSLYVIGGIGDDGAPGMEKIDGKWYNYDCERGSKNNYKERESEDEACKYIISQAEALARQYSMWKE